jgi:hypothetical protein
MAVMKNAAAASPGPPRGRPSCWLNKEPRHAAVHRTNR